MRAWKAVLQEVPRRGNARIRGEGKENGSRNVSGGVIDFLGNLNEIQSALGEGFLRVHRAYLVALDKIEEVDFRHGRLWVGGYECLLSRSGKSELMKRL